jgi:alpha/beta superfamily hydrolase
MIEPRVITTSDGLALEAELSLPETAPRAAMVLCHPHPQFGGTMRSIVIGALFEALPRVGVVCLRFNFRGVEASEGAYGDGHGEQRDAHAAVAALVTELDGSGRQVPLILAGWSFGGDVTLTTVDDAIAAWLAIAPPLRIFPDFSSVAQDPRPKFLALAEHDEFREPSSVVAQVEGWVATETAVVPGASHFFMGRTDRLVEMAVGYVDWVVSRS